MYSPNAYACLLLVFGSMIGCSPPSSDEEVGSDEGHFTQSDSPPPSKASTPAGQFDSVQKLVGETVRVVQKISLSYDRSTTLGFDGRTGCYVVVPTAPTDARSIALGNRYKVSRVDQQRTVPGSVGQTRATFTVTYAGSDTTPDPNADRVGETADFTVQCVVGNTKEGYDVELIDVLHNMDAFLQFGDRAATGQGEEPNFGNR
jgi:hypothetical protein